LYAVLTSPMRVTCPAHVIILDLITLITFSVARTSCEAPHY